LATVHPESEYSVSPASALAAIANSTAGQINRPRTDNSMTALLTIVAAIDRAPGANFVEGQMAAPTHRPKRCARENDIGPLAPEIQAPARVWQEREN
jgi:hypothetical protein